MTATRVQKKKSYTKAREECILAYGGSCRCCGTGWQPYLQLNHLDGGGTAHRNRVGAANVYPELRRLGFPPGYEVLCANCHFALERGGCNHSTGD